MVENAKNTQKTGIFTKIALFSVKKLQKVADFCGFAVIFVAFFVFLPFPALILRVFLYKRFV
jgi:hypothetical protein